MRPGAYTPRVLLRVRNDPIRMYMQAFCVMLERNAPAHLGLPKCTAAHRFPITIYINCFPVFYPGFDI